MKGTRLFLTAILKNFKLKQHFTDKDTFIFCFDLSTDQSVYRNTNSAYNSNCRVLTWKFYF